MADWSGRSARRVQTNDDSQRGSQHADRPARRDHNGDAQIRASRLAIAPQIRPTRMLSPRSSPPPPRGMQPARRPLQTAARVSCSKRKPTHALRQCQGSTTDGDGPPPRPSQPQNDSPCRVHGAHPRQPTGRLPTWPPAARAARRLCLPYGGAAMPPRAGYARRPPTPPVNACCRRDCRRGPRSASGNQSQQHARSSRDTSTTSTSIETVLASNRAKSRRTHRCERSLSSGHHKGQHDINSCTAPVTQCPAAPVPT